MPAPKTSPEPLQPVTFDKAVEVPDLKELWSPAALAGRLVEITSGPATASASGAGRSRSTRAPNLWDSPPSNSGNLGHAALTTASGLLWMAQQRGDPAAWISARASSFYPPDLHACGVDLAALVVVRVAGASLAARATDKLLRSGAFGLVVLDLGPNAHVPAPLLSRLLGLAQKHHAAVVFLTEKPAEAPSLAPIVSLRVSTSRRSVGKNRFACSIQATKDKRRAPGWTLEETFRGPPGLR